MYIPVTLWWLASTTTELADLFAVTRTDAMNCREVQDRVIGMLTMDWLILRWWISLVRTVPARGWLTNVRQTVPWAFS